MLNYLKGERADQGALSFNVVGMTFQLTLALWVFFEGSVNLLSKSALVCICSLICSFKLISLCEITKLRIHVD